MQQFVGVYEVYIVRCKVCKVCKFPFLPMHWPYWSEKLVCILLKRLYFIPDILKGYGCI